MYLLSTNMNGTCKPINYSVFIFDPSLITGELSNEKSKGAKRCRFCGRILDESYFKKDAHAISVSLGNTKFFCPDECDECNEKFGRTLENDVTQFLQIHLLLNQVPKRKGKARHVSGRNFEMQMSNENQFSSDLPLLQLHLYDWKNDNDSTDKVVQMLNNLNISNKTYIPQNVYKAMCKYALSLLPHSETLLYQKTIKWIQGGFYESNLPQLRIASTDKTVKEPVMCLMLRKSSNRTMPHCVVLLHITNLHFAYTLPFCDESEGTNQDDILFDAFWNEFSRKCQLLPAYGKIDLSGTERIELKFDMEMNIEERATPVKLQKDIETGHWIKAEE